MSTPDWTVLPHEGTIICQITGKKHLERLEAALELRGKRRKQRLAILRRLSKQLGFTKVHDVYGHPGIDRPGYWKVSVASPKGWPKKTWPDPSKMPKDPARRQAKSDALRKYNREREAEIDKVKQELLDRVDQINAEVKGSKKAWKLEFGHGYSDKRIYGTLTPMSACPTYKLFKPLPVPDLNSTLRKILDEYGAEFNDLITASSQASGFVLRHPALSMHDGIWYAHFPIEEGKPQPQEVCLPPGFKRLKMSQYWAVQERAAIKREAEQCHSTS